MEHIPESLLIAARAETSAFDDLKSIQDMLDASRKMVRDYELKRADQFILLKDRYSATYRDMSRICGIKAERISEIVLNRRHELS